MRTPVSFPPLQALLFWQTGSLALVAGVVGVRFPVVGLTVFALLLFVDSRSWKPARLAALLVCLIAGWWLGERAEPHRPEVFPLWLEKSLEERKAVRICGEVVRVEGLPNRRLRVRLRNVQPAEGEALPGELNWTWDEPPLTVMPRPIPGERVTVNLKIRPVRGFRNEGMSRSEDYWASHGVFFQAWSKDMKGEPVFSGEPSRPAALRETCRRLVAQALDLESGTSAIQKKTRRKDEGNGRGVIPALLFGDRFYLDSADMERVKSAGLAHSLALSGQHLTVVGLGALALVAGTGMLFPNVFLHVPAFNLLALLAMPLAGVYLWMGNAPPSLVRSALMLLVWCLFKGVSGGLFRRTFQVLRRRRTVRMGEELSVFSALAFPDALLVALTCMVLSDPLCIYDIGVQLSFTAVAGIALASPLLNRLWSEGSLTFSPLTLLRNEISPERVVGSRCLRFLWLTFGVSLAAQVATMPLTMTLFGSTTLWFPTNLIWVPVLGFGVLPLAFLGLIGITAGSAGIPGGMEAGRVVLEVAALPCDWLLRGLAWLQSEMGMASVWGLRPHWTGIVGFGAVLAGAALLVGRKRVPDAAQRLFLCGVLLLLTGPVLRLGDGLTNRVTLRVLDVGQGQALLLEWPRAGSRESVLQRASVQEKGEHDGTRGVPGMARALIDGGGFFSETFDSGRDIVAPILTANHQPRLDFVALSHPDQDHLRGLLFIGAQFGINAVFTAPLPGIDTPPDPPKPLVGAFVSVLAEQRIPRHTLQAGDRLVLWRTETPEDEGTAGELALDVLAPESGTTPAGNNGLIFRLVYRDRGLAFLPGDAEAPYLRALLRRKVELSSDVLVVPHHGSAGSILPELYRVVRPQTAVASAGAFNSYRLPSWRVREELKKQGIPLRITADEGEVVFVWELD